MIKTGVILCIKNNKAGIMTSDGEFIYVKTSKVLPKIGEIYAGEYCKKNVFFPYKYAITAAVLMFIFISSVSAYAYYTPVTSIVLNNPSVSLKANIWNKIISSKSLNADGNLILSNIKLNNKSIDVGLELIIKEAKADNLINDKDISDKKTISLDIKSDKKKNIDISNFKKIIVSNKLNYIIKTESNNNKKIDIIVSDKNINIPALNTNKKKREFNKFNDKNLNIKIAPPKKTIVDTKSNKLYRNSSLIKEGLTNKNKSFKNDDNKIADHEKVRLEKKNNIGNDKENYFNNKSSLKN
jgi:hypothetical protein